MARKKEPVSDNPNLVAYKALVADQVLRLRTEDNLCSTALDRPNRELDLGLDVAYMSHAVAIPFTGTLRVYMAGYGEAYARDEAVKRLKSGNPLTIEAIDYVAEAEPQHLSALPEGADSDPDVIAYKARVRAFADGQVQRGNIDRRIVNPRLVNVGIEPIDGPKEYEYLIQVNPTAVARYRFIVTGEEAAQAELARLIQQDKDRGFVDPSRLRVVMPAETPAPVLAQEPVDA